MDAPTSQRLDVHRSVLVAEVVEFLNVRHDGTYIDATLGGGGHAEAILQRLARGKVLGIDRDPVALARGQAMTLTRQ